MGDRVLVLIRNSGGKGKAHGGAWKVAFADFMTSMMAFFLVMWLLSTLSASTRAEIANYIKTKPFTLFPSGKPAVPKAKVMKEDGGNVLVDSPQLMDNNSVNSLLMLMIDDKFITIKKNLTVASKDEVVRIELADTAHQPLFEKGSAELTDTAKKVVREVALLLQDFDNKIAVEGHADASQSKTFDMDNWNLSTQRANNTLKVLTENGISPKRIFYSAGYSDTKPLSGSNAEEEKNRRVTVLVFCVERMKSIEKYMMPDSK